MQVLSDLLAAGTPPRNLLRVQFDELPGLAEYQHPLLRIVDWYERNILGGSLNAAAQRGEPTYLCFDEVQNLADWDVQLKSLVDSTTTHVLVTGSSALRIEQGRDSLAGRITTLETGPLSLTEIARFRGLDLGEPAFPDNGLEQLAHQEFWQGLAHRGRQQAAERDRVFAWFSARGGYPLPHERAEVSWPEIADALVDNVVKRVIQHDLRTGERGRKRDPVLLEEVFRLACRYAGQTPRMETLAAETKATLGANVGPQRIKQYLRFLGDTLLLRLIEPLEIRLKRRRGPPKICLADHALRAAWLQEQIPLDPAQLAQDPHLAGLAGHLAESVVGATLAGVSGLDLSHFPERNQEPEVDFVLTLGTARIPIEVKYKRVIDRLQDTRGLRAFLDKSANMAPFGVLITQVDSEAVLDPRIVTLPLATLTLLR